MAQPKEVVMTQVSSAVTGAATVTAVQVTELVQWGLNGFPHPIPTEIPMIIGALALTLVHAAVNVWQAKTGGGSK